MTSAKSDSPVSAPYSTGGGGTRLEHRYGATLLAALLTGDPIAELGDDVTPRSVQFQASTISPVDDLVVESDDGDVVRRVSIGVRRAPKLTTSDGDSVPLFQTYLKVVLEHWADVGPGRWRLALAVSNSNPAVRQLKELAVVARASSDADDFRARVTQSGLVNKPVRDRLTHVDALVEQATEGLDNPDGVLNYALTWRLLSVLRVCELRLEGVEESDRTQSVRSLRTVVADASLTAADALFMRLAELTGAYAPSGARVTELTLRRDLVGSPLRRSSTFARAWALLDRLDQRLREWTQSGLREAATTLELERSEARAALAQDMFAAGGGGALVVTGEPDVGKSALTLRAVDQLVTDGATVTAVSLRDLPTTTFELEDRLGASIKDVFAATATGEVRLVVLDGAEAALASHGSLLQELSLAALQAGIGVVAVTRRDGAPRVQEILTLAAHAADVEPPTEHVVPPLTDSEADLLSTTFAALHRLSSEPRSRWLLGRPGLVNLLLQTGVALAPGDLLSEADLFATVWGGLVRNKEQTRLGEPSPDQRDRAMTALARRELMSGRDSSLPDAAALPALRSDGLLRTGSLPAAWRTEEEFASDLVRDFALARLLVTDGWQSIADADAPRWTIRAVRLACQVTLKSSSDVAATWPTLSQTFASLASRFGQRWSEIPLEALLTLGEPQATLTTIWPLLSADGGAQSQTLVRLALQRYATAGFGDSLVLTPVVALAFHSNTVPTGRRLTHRNGDQVGEMVLAWLRGLIHTETKPYAPRQRVREIVLATNPHGYNEFAVEAIASLGPDLDATAEAFLRRVAEERVNGLGPALESLGARLGMPKHQSNLTIDLADAYYIDRRHRSGRTSLDRGIRRHWGVPLTPQAAWHYGPFWQLLQHTPVQAFALINRMLDHAAQIRVRGSSNLSAHYVDSDPPQGLNLELPGFSSRLYVGDGQVWAWYRGSSVGPYPCMSALLAVEQFADQLIEADAIPLKDLVNLLLRDCHNLAMPGLVVGLLVRHFERADDLLDPWLIRPEIWHLESSRAAREGLFQVQGPDAVSTPGRDRRRFSFREVTAHMTFIATRTRSEVRLATLAGLGDTLLSNAQELVGDSVSAAEDLTTIKAWAASFRPENYRTEAAEGGVIVQYEYPEDVAVALGPILADQNATAETLRLGNTYSASDDRVAPVDTLTTDIALARQLAIDPPSSGAFFISEAVAAVAAAAIVAHAQERADVPDSDLQWATDVLLNAVAAPKADVMSYSGSTYSRGADRSAAAALPLLVLPIFDGHGLDRTKITRGLYDCATSLFDEVRIAFALTSGPVWASPCDIDSKGRCRHSLLWPAAQAGLRDARVGEWDETGQHRRPDPIAPPYHWALADTATDCLLLNRLVPPLAAAASAQAAPCIRAEAAQLLAVLLDAHRRTTEHWAEEGCDSEDDRERQVVARVLVSHTIDGDPSPLTEHVRCLTSNANALQGLLRDIAQLFTYDDALRPYLGDVWRRVMTAALDAIDDGADLLADEHWADWAIGALLPVPRINFSDSNPDATVLHARTGWVDPETIADLVDRWLPIAQNEPTVADEVAQLAKCGQQSWQMDQALNWAEQVINGQYTAVADSCGHLMTWLGSLREAGLGAPDGTARWHRLVDGLAAAGDHRAVELQQLEE